eukprot:Em0017g768a
MDRFNVSDKFYHELSMVQTTIPRSHRIKRVRSELDQSLKTKTYRVPGPNHGVYCSLRGFAKNLKLFHEVFRIKLSSDGAKFSRCSNFFLVSFAIRNLEQRVLSPRDNHTVAVVKMPECHDILATTLEPLLQVIKLLMESQIIEVEGKQYQVELFLGGDLKFLLMFLGFGQANSKYACIWCLVSSTDRLYSWKSKSIRSRQIHSMVQKLVESIQDFEELHTNISSWTPDSDVIESKVKYPIDKLQQCLQLHYLTIKAKQWIKDFFALSPVAQGYQKDRVTPYMHIMVLKN